MKRFYATLLTLLIALTLAMPSLTLASGKTVENINNALDAAGRTGFNQSGKQIGLGGLVGSYVTVFLGFVGTIAFVIFLYGGFLWMTARGNEDQVADAKKYLFNGTIGVVVIVLAYSAAYFITSQLYQAAR